MMIMMRLIMFIVILMRTMFDYDDSDDTNAYAVDVVCKC